MKSKLEARSRHLSVNGMIRQIENLVCIRKIWRCRAGWGMMFIIPKPGIPKEFQEEKDMSVVYRYYPTLEQCVRMEFAYWVLGKEMPLYPSKKGRG